MTPIAISICLLLWASIFAPAEAQCPNRCSGNGDCTSSAQCECFQGWTGSLCDKRTCPTGTLFNDIASATDVAHAQGVCSGHGACDTSTGTCNCAAGFEGDDCSRSKCPNDCNGHGACISMKAAGDEYDGFMFNHTATYNRWDAFALYGCRCDPGFSGYDCSRKNCEYGNDPRGSAQANETVRFVCDCAAGNCQGKFRLRMMGRIATLWVAASATAADLAASLLSIPSKYRDTKTYTYTPVYVTTGGSTSNPICVAGTATTTLITFKRLAGDVPALSVYQSKITNGAIYFSTEQTLRCDCSGFNCYGAFQVSYDGEVSASISAFDSGAGLVAALSAMKTFIGSSVVLRNTTRVVTLSTVAVDASANAICVNGAITTNLISLRGPIGNLPKLKILSSVAKGNYAPVPFDTTMTSTVLTVSTEDGRDDNVKECNGAGYCDYTTGQCVCDPLFGPDADMGPCGRLRVKTSDWQGVWHCPGVVGVDGVSPASAVQRHEEYMYVSLNTDKNNSYFNYSIIERYLYGSPIDGSPHIDDRDAEFILRLTSNQSAGPMVIDRTKTMLYFVDNNPKAPFIGRFLLTFNATAKTYEVFTTLTGVVTGFTINPYFLQRKLYWTQQGQPNFADGKILWMSLDAQPGSAVNSLVASIGQANLVDPSGIVVHMFRQRIYWIDKDTTKTPRVTALRSSYFDGSDYTTTYLYENVENMTMPSNVTDLKIDYRNDTLYFLNVNSKKSAIVRMRFNDILFTSALDGNFKDYFKLDVQANTDPVDFGFPAYLLLNDFTYQEKYPGKSTYLLQMKSPKYLLIDEKRNSILWTDPELRRIKFYQFIENTTYSGFGKYIDFGDAYINLKNKDVYAAWAINYPGFEPKMPVGMVIDDLQNVDLENDFLECHGNGRCLGLAGNWKCECNQGYYGDCLHRTCPRGKAWFGEPVVDNVAHDTMVECSNAGTCDRLSGECQCHAGFEGAACERLMCPRSDNEMCSGNGRCVSIRRLALSRKDPVTLEPSPAVYGSRLNDPATWDSDRVHGCLADEYGYAEDYHNITTYVGSNLDQLSCPAAFDPRLTLPLVTGAPGVTEVQRIACTATGGSFRLTFRGKTTAAINYDATINTFKSALLALRTIGSLDVLPASLNVNTDRVCAVSCVEVEFKTELGNLPAMTIDATGLTGGTAVITTTRQGAGVLYECGGRGDCDASTGECKCWPYRVSSNGFGTEQGTRGDCGFNVLY